MKYIKVLLSFFQLSIPVKIVFYRNVLLKMTANPNFTTPDISLALIKTAIDALEASELAAAGGGGRAATALMQAAGTKPTDYQWAVFHQPNAKFPQRVAGQLGFSLDQIAPGLLVPIIGNTYAGAAMIGLTGVLDIAKAGDRILMVSFGSGAGSDAFDILVTDKLEERRDLATKTQQYIARRTEIDYATYVRFRGKLAMK